MNLNIPSKTETSIFNNQSSSLLTVTKTEENEKAKKVEELKQSGVGLI